MGPVGSRHRSLILPRLVLGLLVGLAPTALAPTVLAATAGPSTPTHADPPPPVVLIGVQGLTWEDIHENRTPHLWDLAGGGGAANLSVRTVTPHTCPADGWLTISAGQRAVDAPVPEPGCAPLPDPVAHGTGAEVPGHAERVEVNAQSSYAARVGTLGDTITEDGVTLAVGPGGALALADSAGDVDRYRPTVEDLRATDWESSGPLVAAVDLSDLTKEPAYGSATAHDVVREPGPANGPPRAPASEENGAAENSAPENSGANEDDEPADRAARSAHADREIAALVEAAPADARIIVAGISAPPGPPSLTAAIDANPATPEPSLLTSQATRREGLVTLTDITATLVEPWDDALAVVVGAPFREVPRAETPAAAVQELRDHNTAAQVVQDLLFGFFSALVAAQLLIYAAAAFVVRRYAGTPRCRILAATRVVALAGASFPVASYLANLLPWWHSPAPHVALLATMGVAVGLVVGLAMGGPWRRTILGPATVVAGVTAAVLLADTVTGSTLQVNALTGYTAIVAGRFFGVGNIALATFTTGTLMAIAGIAYALQRSGHRAAAVVVAAVIGVTVIIVIGAPGLGTSFGGMIAAVPGVAVTVAMLAGLRVSVPRVAAVSVGGVLVVGLVAFLDSLRPPGERTHFGAFFEELRGGQAGVIVLRKLEAMVGTLGNWQLTVLAGVALLFLFLVLNKPTDWRAGALQRAYEYAPPLRAGLTGTLVTGLVGFVANDSGIAIPAIALTIAVPLALSACLWVLIRENSGRPHNPDTGNGVVSSEGRL